MEPASRNAWAIYIRVPDATSSMSSTCIKASAMLLTISSTAQAYEITFSAAISYREPPARPAIRAASRRRISARVFANFLVIVQHYVYMLLSSETA